MKRQINIRSMHSQDQYWIWPSTGSLQLFFRITPQWMRLWTICKDSLLHKCLLDVPWCCCEHLPQRKLPRGIICVGIKDLMKVLVTGQASDWSISIFSLCHRSIGDAFSLSFDALCSIPLYPCPRNHVIMVSEYESVMDLLFPSLPAILMARMPVWCVFICLPSTRRYKVSQASPESGDFSVYNWYFYHAFPQLSDRLRLSTAQSITGRLDKGVICDVYWKASGGQSMAQI